MLSVILAVVFYFLGMFESDNANKALSSLYGDPLEKHPVIKAVVLIGWPVVAAYLLIRLTVKNVVSAFKPAKIDDETEAIIDADIKALQEKINYWTNYKKQRNESNRNN